jgi:hypothetical protein
MRGLRFRPAAAVDHLNAGDSAAIVIGIANGATECSIAHFSIDEDLHNLSLLLV